MQVIFIIPRDFVNGTAATSFFFSFFFLRPALFFPPLGLALLGAGGARVETKVRPQHFTNAGSATIAINGDYCTLQDTGLGGGGWSARPGARPASQPATSQRANSQTAQPPNALLPVVACDEREECERQSKRQHQKA